MKTNLTISESGRKKFVKDSNLPIPIIKSPYFEYFLDLYEELLKSKTKYLFFKESILKHENEHNFFGNNKKICEKILKEVSESEAYKKMPSKKEGHKEFIKKYELNKKYSLQSRKIYSKQNCNQTYISIDLEKANFQSLKFHDPNIVLNCETYEEFIGKFTDSEYIKKSKVIRQVIFGKLNPKKQVIM